MAGRNFNVKETVNKNIEKNQFPAFSNHRSMVGWCSMNYPKTLINPIYIDKDTLPEDRKFDLDYMFQKKNPTDRDKVEFVRPLSNLEGKGEDKEGGVAESAKVSSMTLATTKHSVKAKIVLSILFSSKRTIAWAVNTRP